MGRLHIYTNTAKKILTDWDYSNLNDIVKHEMTIDFKALIVKLVVFIVHLICVITLPVSVLFVIKIGRNCEIKNLKGWVKTMRRNKSFFRMHYYSEIKQHIHDHKDSYYLTLNW